jgi:hypothetical protein
MTIDEGSGEEKRTKRQDRPYTHYLSSKRLDIARNLWCASRTINYAVESGCIRPGVDTVIEYFGGLGTMSRIIQDVIHPPVHIVYDVDKFCVDYLRKYLGNGAQVEQGNFFDVVGIPANVAFLDVETFTLLKMDALFIKALTRAFACYNTIVLVDTAVGKYHLNYEAYGNAFRTPVPTLEDYFKRLSDWYDTVFGWSILSVASHVRASYMLMYPVESLPDNILFEYAPKEADGYFEVVSDEPSSQ